MINKKNIMNLVNKINLMPNNNKEKAIEIKSLYSFVHFFLETEQITKKEAYKVLSQVNEYKTLYSHYINKEKNNVIDIYNSCDKLNSMYKNILDYANKFDLFIVQVPDVNFNLLLKAAKEFMRFIDNDVIDLFNKMVDNKLIFEKVTNNYAGETYRLDCNPPGFILKYNNITFDKINTLIHEMGHVYYFYLEKNYPNIVKSNLTNECMSIIFESLFIDYLRLNYLVDSESINRYERCYNINKLHIINATYLVNELLMDGKINVNYQIEKTKLELSFEDFYKLSIIKPKDDKYLKYLSFDQNYYAYGYILSTIIREMFQKNEIEARKFIKELPTYARELNARDLINLFDKTDYINATNRNTAKVLSKTFYK